MTRDQVEKIITHWFGEGEATTSAVDEIMALEERCGCGVLLSEHGNSSNGYCTGADKIAGGGGAGEAADLQHIADSKGNVIPESRITMGKDFDDRFTGVMRKLAEDEVEARMQAGEVPFDWKTWFRERFGYAADDDESSTGALAGCDDCYTNRVWRRDIEAFIEEELKREYQRGFDRACHLYQQPPLEARQPNKE